MRLYDSKTRRLQDLNPVKPGHVSIYLCGATVQGSPHIGHMRSALAFDILVRWLRRSGYQVTYVRNVTDIDDKILNKSAEAGTAWWAHAARFEREFSQAYHALGILPPTYEPRATGHITDQIELIEILIEKGHAYADSSGNVYFDVRSLPDYGSLTHQALDDLRTTEDDSQIDAEIEAGKRDSRDFALWKAAKPSEPDTASWPSPWGRGRPGWHLECSAMARRYLGETFDIHGGGIELRFPHHENEQAQSHGADWGFAQIWVHNAWVTIKGEKMAKSLGNSLVVSELLKRWPAVVLRLALGTVHHRSTVEYSEETLTAAAATWERLQGFVKRAEEFVGPVPTRQVATAELPQAFVDALNDDLNLSAAMACVHEHLKAGNTALAEMERAEVSENLLSVRAMLDVLGLDPGSQRWRDSEDGAGATASGGAPSPTKKALDTLVEAILEDRAAARQAKDWGRADQIRDQLSAAGVVVEDGADGASWHLA